MTSKSNSIAQIFAAIVLFYSLIVVLAHIPPDRPSLDQTVPQRHHTQPPESIYSLIPKAAEVAESSELVLEPSTTTTPTVLARQTSGAPWFAAQNRNGEFHDFTKSAELYHHCCEGVR